MKLVEKYVAGNIKVADAAEAVVEKYRLRGLKNAQWREHQMVKKIWAANYLTVENVERYRKIMRFFYTNHRQMQGVLYRPEILEYMRSEHDVSYKEFELNQDLENLVSWGNLQRQQEMIRPKSIEEYRNKNFRYQITNEGIIVEEMVFQLTHKKNATRGALDEKGIRRLLKLLNQLINGEGDLLENWLATRQEFRKIGEDTANYIGYITSPDVDSRMKAEQFLIYKDRFVNYLRNFIATVQSLYHQFKVVVAKIDQIDQETLIEELYQKELEIPTFDGMSKEEVTEQFQGEVRTIKTWFLGRENRPSEYENLMQQTDQMITKITGLIYFYGQEVQQYQSRRKDYLQIAKWFQQAEDLAEAQKRYAAIFGLSQTRHFYVPEASEATSTKQDSWELPASTLFLNNRGRGARLERKAKSFTIDYEQQKAQLQAYQEKQEAYKQKIESYFIDNVIDFSTINHLDAQSRKIFFKWMSSAIATYASVNQKVQTTVTQKIATELNYDIQVTIERNQRVVVPCEDGDLEMPKVKIEKVSSL